MNISTYYKQKNIPEVIVLSNSCAIVLLMAVPLQIVF